MKSEWRNGKLADAVELVIDYRGKTPKKLGGDWSESGYRALSAKNIKTGNIVQPETIRYVDENLYNLWMKEEVKYGDILITSEAPFGEVYHWLSDEKIVLSQRIFGIRAKKSFDSSFLYYYMSSNSFQTELLARATGTTVFGLRQPELLKCGIRYPDKKTQQQISSVLRALDNKIAINNVINDNLQQQALAIYAEMFMTDSAVQKQTGVLSDIADIVMGQSPSSESYNERGDGMVFFQGRAEFGFRFPAIRLFTTDSKRTAQENDILMSVRAPVGDINIAHERCCIGRGLGALRSKTNQQSFLFYTMIALRPQLDVFNGEGTVFGSINRDSLNNLPVAIPERADIQRFEEIVAPMDALIRSNHDEICRLERIRKALLPRLMNGAMDVSKIKI